MGNQRTRRRPTDAQWRQLYSNLPEAGDTPPLLEVIQADSLDRNAAERLFEEADIDLSGFLTSARERIETLQRRTMLSPATERPMETLTEAEFLDLTDDDVQSFLESEGIDCAAFLVRASGLIDGQTLVLFKSS